MGEFYGKHIQISADFHKLSQVVRNLLSNAMKFTPIGGSVTVAVSCSLEVSSGTFFLKVCVTDTGHGISLVRCRLVFILYFYTCVVIVTFSGKPVDAVYACCAV
jgi:signal transduction histidine kinase